jgi:hypothetical protein
MSASARNCVPARILISQDREKCGAFVGIGRLGGSGMWVCVCVCVCLCVSGTIGDRRQIGGLSKGDEKHREEKNV